MTNDFNKQEIEVRTDELDNVGGGPHFGAGLTIDRAAERFTKKA